MADSIICCTKHSCPNEVGKGVWLSPTGGHTIAAIGIHETDYLGISQRRAWGSPSKKKWNILYCGSLSNSIDDINCFCWCDCVGSLHICLWSRLDRIPSFVSIYLLFLILQLLILNNDLSNIHVIFLKNPHKITRKTSTFKMTSLCTYGLF